MGICRDVLDAVTEHCSMRQQAGRPLVQYGVVQRRLAHAAAQIYAMESMTYLVGGYLTAQPQRDLCIESAAVKVCKSDLHLVQFSSLQLRQHSPY